MSSVLAPTSGPTDPRAVVFVMGREEPKFSAERTGQTKKKAKKSVQLSTFYFVDVAVTPSRAHIPVRDAQKERCIRAHVMKDYLRKNFRLPSHSIPSPGLSNLSDRLIQFRVSSQAKQERSRRGTKEVSSDERGLASASAPTKMRPIVPKDHHSLREVASARSLANNLLCKFPSTINTSTPGTLTLLEYYYHSFWDNSLAVNPEGQWMSTAVSDPAMFHATLCLVALHKAQRSEKLQQANSYLWHRGEAMRLISQNLANPEQAISDATIGAVAILSASDNSMHWPSIPPQTSHMQGIITLNGLRGGLHGTNMDRHIQRVVAWADILHASTHNSLPQLGIAPDSTSTHRDIQRLKDVVGKYHYTRAVGQDVVPTYCQKVLENLQDLARAKSLLKKKAVSNSLELRLIFSSLLFATEHRILELGHTAASSGSAIANVPGIEAVKAAALIFSFHGLRDMAITAAFFHALVWRLREGLGDVFDSVFANQNPAYLFDDEIVAAPFLLWLCINGWKASAIKSRQTDRAYFVEKAAVLCERARIDSAEELKFQTWRIVFTVENYELACDGFWVDISTWTASHDTARVSS